MFLKPGACVSEQGSVRTKWPDCEWNLAVRLFARAAHSRCPAQPKCCDSGKVTAAELQPTAICDWWREGFVAAAPSPPQTTHQPYPPMVTEPSQGGFKLNWTKFVYLFLRGFSKYFNWPNARPLSSKQPRDRFWPRVRWFDGTVYCVQCALSCDSVMSFNALSQTKCTLGG